MGITGLSSVANLASGIIDKIWPPKADPTEKLKAQHELQVILENRENEIIEAQKEIIVSEMAQGDNFTKRARPTIVYAGLGFIFLVHVFFPMVTFFTRETMPEIALPAEFWWAWGGVCSVWVLGRSAEKRGAEGKTLSMITGNK